MTHPVPVGKCPSLVGSDLVRDGCRLCGKGPGSEVLFWRMGFAPVVLGSGDRHRGAGRYCDHDRGHAAETCYDDNRPGFQTIDGGNLRRIGGGVFGRIDVRNCERIGDGDEKMKCGGDPDCANEKSLGPGAQGETATWRP